MVAKHTQSGDTGQRNQSDPGHGRAGKTAGDFIKQKSPTKPKKT